MLSVWYIGWGFLLGIIAGSGLTSWLWRAEHPELRGRLRSACIGCNKTLRWFELIPVLSFIAARGACRRCGHSIPFWYLICELAGGILGAMIGFLAFTRSLSLIFIVSTTLICLLFLAIALYDACYRLIPMLPVWISIVLSSLFQIIIMNRSWSEVLLTGLCGAGFFLAQYLVSRGRWIGSGDIWLGALLGAWFPWPKLLLALWGAYVSGAIVGLSLLVTSRATRTTALPLGTFLTGMAIITVLYGDQLLTWYSRLSF